MDVFTANQGRLSGLEVLRAMIASGKGPPIAETLKFELVEVSEGHAVFQAIPGAHANNPIGSIHGGYASTLLDSACGCAVHASLGPHQGYTTLDLRVAFHRAMTSRTGLVRAEGKVLTLGRRVAFAEGRLVGADGRLYATSTSTLLVYDIPPSKSEGNGADGFGAAG